MEKYPFVGCLEPKRIVNPYTHEWMTVPCGHCKACAVRKNGRLALQCELESTKHKYCLFVTLTYANRYIPTAEIFQDLEKGSEMVYRDGIVEELKTYDLVDTSTSEILHTFNSTDEKVQSLLSKFYLFDKVPYLRKDDLQKWFKRFRKAAGKYTTDKVRYFASGEYGPVHFRPHYHILLWFEDEALYKVCPEIIHKTWPYGRVDVQLSTGKASDYVASYVNSSCTLPEIFRSNAVRPFSLHSRFLGQGFFESSREKVYALSPVDFIKRGAIINGKYKSFDLWTACYTAYYPKCRGFSVKDDGELYKLYTVYESASRRFPNACSVYEIAQGIYEMVDFTAGESFYFPVLRNEVDELFMSLFLPLFNPDTFKCSSELPFSPPRLKELIVSRIYSQLLLSRHFLDFCCGGSLDYHFRMSMIKKIKDFYSALDYMHLTEMYEAQQLFLETDLLGDDGLPYFYDNADWSVEVLQATPLFDSFRRSRLSMFEGKIKHKKLNDNNRIFLDD